MDFVFQTPPYSCIAIFVYPSDKPIDIPVGLQLTLINGGSIFCNRPPDPLRLFLLVDFSNKDSIPTPNSTWYIFLGNGIARWLKELLSAQLPGKQVPLSLPCCTLCIWDWNLLAFDDDFLWERALEQLLESV